MPWKERETAVGELGAPVCVWPAGLLPDDCQGDEVHQEGHDGHVRGPVGVSRATGPALHFTIESFLFPNMIRVGMRTGRKGLQAIMMRILACFSAQRKERDAWASGNSLWEHTWYLVEKDRGGMNPQSPVSLCIK